jgi:hypothetical protein
MFGSVPGPVFACCRWAPSGSPVRVLSFAQHRIHYRIQCLRGRQVAAVLRSVPSECPNRPRARGEDPHGGTLLGPRVAVQRGHLLVPHQIGGSREIARGGQFRRATMTEVVGREGRRLAGRITKACSIRCSTATGSSRASS